MATIEELEARIKALETRIYGHNAEAKSKGVETSIRIQSAVREYAKRNRLVAVNKLAKQIGFSNTRVHHEMKILVDEGIVELLGRGVGYLSRIYEGK